MNIVGVDSSDSTSLIIVVAVAFTPEPRQAPNDPEGYVRTVSRLEIVGMRTGQGTGARSRSLPYNTE